MTAPKKDVDKASSSARVAFAFEWQRRVSRDGSLIMGSHRLALYFAQQLWPSNSNEYQYYSKNGQKFFADEINVSRKTVQKWFNDLVKNGHLQVMSRKGQGLVNHYIPVIKPEDVDDAVVSTDPVTEVVEDPPELAAVEAAPSAGVEMFDPQTAGLIEGVSNEELYLMDTNHKYDIELLMSDGSLVDSSDLLSDLYEIFLSSFPEASRDVGRYMSRIWFLTLIHRGFYPSQIIIEAREYVRAARLAGQPVRGPLKWAHSRVQADSAERHAVEG